MENNNEKNVENEKIDDKSTIDVRVSDITDFNLYDTMEKGLEYPIIVVANSDLTIMRMALNFVDILTAKGIDVICLHDDLSYASTSLDYMSDMGFETPYLNHRNVPDNFMERQCELIYSTAESCDKCTVIHFTGTKENMRKFNRSIVNDWKKLTNTIELFGKSIDYITSYKLFNRYEVPAITICGSYSFMKEMKMAAQLLTSKGFIVNVPHRLDIDIIGEPEVWNYTQVDATAKHYSKIHRSDAIYVIDVNGYIGESTTHEILCATASNIPVFYYEDPAYNFHVSPEFIGYENLTKYFSDLRLIGK